MASDLVLMRAVGSLPWGKKIPPGKTPSGTQYTLDAHGNIQAKLEDVDALVVLGLEVVGAAGSAQPTPSRRTSILSVTDGDTTVSNVSSISLTGATVTDGDGGEAQIEIS